MTQAAVSKSLQQEKIEVPIKQEKGSDEIVFKAMERAINKIVMIVELIKVFRSSVPSSKDGKDHLYSLSTHVAGCILIPFSLETTRHVSVIKITLSKELDASSVGSGRFARL